MPTLETDQDGNPAYGFKPSLMGAMCRFTLKPDALHWEIGRRSGQVRYDRIQAIRLSYRPVTMQSHRFTAEIWSPDAPKIQIVSASWRSIMEQERLDAAYAAFVAELHRRLAAAGATARFIAGLPVAIYAVGVAVFGTVFVAVAIMTARTVQAADWTPAAIVAIFFAVLTYQFGLYFWRNRPARYRPDAIPQQVLPRPQS
jgi:hypothetical protein